MARGSSPIYRGRVSNYVPKRVEDSPSRQLQYELERTFAQIQLQETERQKLYIFERKQVQDELNAKEFAQAAAHRAELDQAIAKHEAVRQQALAVLHAHIKEEEEKQRRKEEEARRRREEEERRKAEQERKAREEQERKIREERERQEAQKRAEAEKARIAQERERERQEREAAARRERQQQEETKRQAEAEAVRQKQEADRAASLKATTSTASAPSTAISQDHDPYTSNPEIRHKHYLNIHQSLKKFRTEFWARVKKEPQLKKFVGDARRDLKVAVGQLSLDDKNINKLATEKVKTWLMKALKEVPSQPVPLNNYLPPHLGLLDKNTTTIPAAFLYLVSIFSKAIINSFVSECAVNVKAAEPIGTMVAQVFALPDFQFARNVPSANSGLHYKAFGGDVPTPPMKPDSVSLITILMCKFHAAAPPLFGISGSEKTQAGKLRLGWRKSDDNGGTQKLFIREQEQYDRLVGLGAGYASIALRNFSKTKLTNPYPPSHFWSSMAYIIDTKPAEVQPSQMILLKNMLENSLDRFILFFGAAGIAALRQAVVLFPSQLPDDVGRTPAAKSLVLLAETWKREKHLHLN